MNALKPDPPVLTARIYLDAPESMIRKSMPSGLTRGGYRFCGKIMLR